MFVQCCLNGARPFDAHPALPRTPVEFAREARRAVWAGATALHLHPRDATGTETFAAKTMAAVLRAVRTACPGTPIGTTTGAWIAGDGDERHNQIALWTVVPEYVSVNFSEHGVAALCDMLLGKGIGIEAGLTSPADARLFVELGLAERCVRVLIETEAGTLDAQRSTASAIETILDASGITVPRLLHGFDVTAWPMLHLAIERGYDVRMGLEDTLLLPDGSIAEHNGSLVAEAFRTINHRRRPMRTGKS